MKLPINFNECHRNFQLSANTMRRTIDSVQRYRSAVQTKTNKSLPKVTRQVSLCHPSPRHGPQADLSDSRHINLCPGILVFTEPKEEKEEEASGDAISAKKRYKRV